jgi:serine/threonine protein kinase
MMSAGSRIVNYEVLELIGSGSQGLVYLCRHTRLDRIDAVKVLLARLSDNAKARARFEREAAHAARLQHVNIATVHDAGETEDGFLYVAMRYIAGPDLARLIRSNRMNDPKRVLTIIDGLASALDAAHAAGLVHRDVKPSNVLIEHEQLSDEHAVLVDFGISKWWYEIRSGTVTAMGTYAYLAPERIVGHAGDDRSDQYSLGCTTFECLTGKPPFPSHSPAQIVKAHLEVPPPRVTDSRPQLSTAVDEVVARAMAKNPMDRYPSCGAFVTALRAALDPVPAAAHADPRSVASISLPTSVTSATSLTLPKLAAVAVEEETTVLGNRPPAPLPLLPTVRRQVSVLSLVALTAVVTAYGTLIGSGGRAVGIAIAADAAALALARAGRRHAVRRNQRAGRLAVPVTVLALVFGGVVYYFYQEWAIAFFDQVRDVGEMIGNLIHRH